MLVFPFRLFQSELEDEYSSAEWFNMTGGQLFWLGYAQDHCLTRNGFQQSISDILASQGSPGSRVRWVQARAGYAPPPWRVNAVLATQPHFAQDFHCKPSAKMYRHNRAELNRHIIKAKKKSSFVPKYYFLQFFNSIRRTSFRKQNADQFWPQVEVVFGYHGIRTNNTRASYRAGGANFCGRRNRRSRISIIDISRRN